MSVSEPEIPEGEAEEGANLTTTGRIANSEWWTCGGGERDRVGE